MLDPESKCISAEDHNQYMRVVNIVVEAAFLPCGGKVDDVDPEDKKAMRYNLLCNFSKEDLQEAIDFITELKEFLPTSKEFHREV